MHEGYRYHKNRGKSDKIYWRCWRRTCNAFIQTSVFDIDDENPQIDILQVADHNHPDETDMITVSALKNKMVQAIEADPSKSIKLVYDEIVKTADGCDQVPKFNNVRSKLNRKRASLLPSWPHNDEFVNGNERGSTWRGQDSRSHQGHRWGVLVLGTDANFAKLSRCQDVYIDGLRPYKHFVTIHGKYSGKVMPLVTCLMTGRTVAQYKHLMMHVRQKVHQVTGYSWRPLRVVTTNLTSSHLQNSETKLLDIHWPSDCELTSRTKPLDVQRSSDRDLLYSQGIWRRAWALGLAGLFRRHGRLRRCVQRVTSHGCQPPSAALERQTIGNSDANRTTQEFPGLADIIQNAERHSVGGRRSLTRPSPLCCVFDRRLNNESNHVVKGKKLKCEVNVITHTVIHIICYITCIILKVTVLYISDKKCVICYISY